MKLVITIPLDGNDLEKADFDSFVKEAEEAVGIKLMCGRSVSEDESHIIRSFEIKAEYFKAVIE